MKKIFVTIFILIAFSSAYAQNQTTAPVQANNNKNNPTIILEGIKYPMSMADYEKLKQANPTGPQAKTALIPPPGLIQVNSATQPVKFSPIQPTNSSTIPKKEITPTVKQPGIINAKDIKQAVVIPPPAAGAGTIKPQ